jgi:hypothetical protein
MPQPTTLPHAPNDTQGKSFGLQTIRQTYQQAIAIGLATLLTCPYQYTDLSTSALMDSYKILRDWSTNFQCL